MLLPFWRRVILGVGEGEIEGEERKVRGWSKEVGGRGVDGIGSGTLWWRGRRWWDYLSGMWGEGEGGEGGGGGGGGCRFPFEVGVMVGLVVGLRSMSSSGVKG